MADSDFSVKAIISAQTSQFEKGMKKAQLSTDALSGSIKKIGTLLKTTFSVMAIKDITKAFANITLSFDEATASIVKGTGKTGKALDDLSKSVSDSMKNGIGRSAQEIGQMVADLNTRFGATGKELNSLIDEFDMFSDVTGTDTKTAINSTADVLSKWNVDLKQTDLYLDQLVRASQESGASVEELSGGLKSGQAIFSKFGMNVTKSTAFLATLKKNGIDSSTAIFGMRTALAEFSKSGKDAEKEFEKISKKIANAKTETEALKIATEVFGTRAGPEMVRVLQSGNASFEEMTSKLRKARGALKETDTASRTVKDAFQDLKAAVTSLFAGFSGDNELRNLVDSITSAVGKLNTEELNDAIKTFKKNLGTILSYSAKILTTLYDNFKQIFEDISDLLNKNSKVVDEWKDNFYKSINALYKIVQSAFGVIQALIHGNWKMMWEYAKLIVLEIIKTIYDNISSFFTEFEDKINKVLGFLNLPIVKDIGVVGPLKTSLEALSLLFKGNDKISEELGKSINKVTDNIDKLAEAEKDYTAITIKDLDDQKSGIDKLSSAFKNHGKVTTEVSDQVSDAIEQNEEDIESESDELQGFYNRLVKLLQGTQKMVGDTINDSISMASSWLKDIGQRVYGALPKWVQSGLRGTTEAFKNTGSVIAGIVTQIGKVLKKSIEPGKKIFTTTINFFVVGIKGMVKVVSETINVIGKILSSGFNIFKKLININFSDLLDALLAFEDSVLTFFVETLPKLPSYVDSILKSIGTLLTTLLNSVKKENIATVLFGVLESLKANLPGIMETISSMLQSSTEFMTENLSTLVYEFLTLLGDNVPQVINDLLDLLSTTISEGVKGIIQWLDEGGLQIILQMLLDLQTKLQDLVLDLLSQIATFLSEHTEDIGAFLADSLTSAFNMLPELIDSLLKIITALIQAIADCFKDKEMIQAMVDGLVGGIEAILDNLGDIVSAVIDLIFSVITAIVPKLPEIILKIIGAIAKALPDLVSDIAGALGDGIKSIFKSIFNKDFWVDTLKTFKETLANIVKSVFRGIGKLFDISDTTSSGAKKGTAEKATDITLGILTGGVYNLGKGIGKMLHWWADGTDNAPAGLSVVGEAGPELVNFKGGEQVLSNANTKKLLSGSSGTTVNQNITFNNLQDTSAYEMINQLKQYNRSLAINGII